MAESPRGLLARLTAALAPRPAPPPPAPRLGDLAWADPRRLFPAPHGITPYNPSTLVARQGLQVFDRMRRDEQVKAALTFKKWAVLGGGYELVAPEGRADTWAPKRFVEEVLDGLEETLPGALVDILSALDYGVSVTEHIWAPGQTRALRGALVLTRLETRAPWSFEFEADEHGRLKPGGFRQDQMGTKAVLPAEKFLLYVHDGLFGNWYGTSDLEAAYRAWWLKDNAYKWFGMLLERYGIPPVLALYDPSKYQGMKAQEIVTVLERIQAATVGALPRPQGGDETLSLWAPERLALGAKDVFIPGFDLLDRWLAKAILMPQLLGFTADAEEGSYARSQTHFDAFLLVVRRLQDDLRVRAIERRVIRPLVDLNFGPQPMYPSFRFLPLTKEIKKELYDVWAAMVGAKVVRRQTTDEAHIRQALDMPEVDESAVIEDEPEPAEPGDDPAGEGAGESERTPRSNAVRRFVARAPTRYERRVDFAAVGATLDRREAEARQALTAVLTRQRDALVAVVSRAGGPLAASAIRDVTLPGQADLAAGLWRFLEATFQAGQASLRREAPSQRFAQHGPLFVPREALRVLRERALTLAATTDERLLGAVKSVLLFALETGEAANVTIGKLRGAFEPYLGDPTVVRDAAAIEPYRLETILRTESTRAFNHGRLVEARDPDVAPFLHGLLFSAILDERTTEVCQGLDGRVIRMSDPDLSRLTPPLHFQCRSLLVPVTLDQTLDEADVLTPAQAGRAKELAGEGFV